jgi:hypothetical protein
MESLKLVKTLALLPMTLDTYGLSEKKYLDIFEKKAEFACKALRIVENMALNYNISMEPKFFWDLYQEIGYATDDACRVKQKKEDPEALEERSYTSTTYPTTGAVFTEVQKLEKLMNTFIEQNKDGFLGEERESNFPCDQEFLQFTEKWWESFMVYEGEEGRAYARHVFNHVSKQHLIDFLRDRMGF